MFKNTRSQRFVTRRYEPTASTARDPAAGIRAPLYRMSVSELIAAAPHFSQAGKAHGLKPEHNLSEITEAINASTPDATAVEIAALIPSRIAANRNIEAEAA